MQKHRDIPSQLPAIQPAQIQDTSWIQTNEIPAVRPGLSTWDKVQQQQQRAPVTPIPRTWQDELPKSNHQRNLPVFRETLDPEKVAARITWIAMVAFSGLIIAICLIKVVLMVVFAK